MEKDFDKKRIAGSLKHGLVGSSVRSLLIMTVIFVALGSLSAIVGVTLLAVYTALGSVNWGISAICIFVICVVLFTALFFGLRCVRKKINGRKEIELWLEDAVMLKAYSQYKRPHDDGPVVNFLNYLGNNNNDGYTIRISFKYDGSHLKFTSSHDYCWHKYLDKEIDVLYSPKYREVILLKPE
ncbi:MAG: hypothetical protein K2M47_06995 [Clostridiales bacterium]|nr:hypothetical protein [Clostridiales bacterium]